MNSLRSLLLALMASLALAGNTTSNSTDDSSSSSDNTTVNNNNPSSSSSADDNSTTTTTTTTTTAGNTTTTTTTTTVAGNTTTTTTTTTAASNDGTTTTTTTAANVTEEDSNMTTGASTQQLQAGLSLSQSVDVPDSLRAVCTDYLGMAQIFTFASKTYLATKTSTTSMISSGAMPNCKDDGTLPSTTKCLKHTYTDATNPHSFNAWSIAKGYDTIDTSSCTQTAITLSRVLSNKRRLSTSTVTRGDDIAIVYAQNGNTVPPFVTTAKSAITTVMGQSMTDVQNDLAAAVTTVTTAFQTGTTTGVAIPKTVSSTGVVSTAPNVAAVVKGDPAAAAGSATITTAVSSFAANVTITVASVGEMTGAATTTSTTSGSVSNGVATAVLAAVAGATMVMAF